MAKKQEEPESIAGIVAAAAFFFFVIWLFYMGISSWNHITTIDVDDFTCSASKRIDKENCADLAKTYMVTKSLGNESISKLIENLDKLNS